MFSHKALLSILLALAIVTNSDGSERGIGRDQDAGDRVSGGPRGLEREPATSGLRRRLMMNNGGNNGGGNSGGGNNGGDRAGSTSNAAVEETSPCLPFDDGFVQTALQGTVGSCQNNVCPGGCCRVHNDLTCDNSSPNQFPHQPCVCNDITNNTHIEPSISIGGNETRSGNTTSNEIEFPAQAGDCDEPTFFQDLEGVTSCTKQSDCAGSNIQNACCVSVMCICYDPMQFGNDDSHLCVPDP